MATSPVVYPGPINRCSNGIGEINRASGNQGVLPQYCACDLSPTFNTSNEYWCRQVGNGEWDYVESFDNCTFSNSDNPYGVQSFCVFGLPLAPKCERVSFTGDPLQCCLQDYSGCGRTSLANDEREVNLCFTDSTQSQVGNSCDSTNCNNTCSPCVRSIITNQNSSDGAEGTCGSSNCRDILFIYCTGADLPPGNSSWISRWLNFNGKPLRFGAANVLVRNIYGTDCGSVDLYFQTIQNGSCVQLSLARSQNEDFLYAQSLLEATIERYYADGFSLTATPGSEEYTAFTDYFYYGLACPFPLLCQNILTKICSAFTVDNLTFNSGLADLCGCYLPNSQYEKYVNVYQVDKQCTPSCNRLNTVPIVSSSNQPIICTQNLCIIDNNTISLANSIVNTSVNITQLCANCGTGACVCSIENNTIQGVDSAIGSINITEQCAATECTYVDPISGASTTLPCDIINDETISESLQIIREQAFVNLSRRNMIWVILVAIVVIVIITGIFLYIFRCKRRYQSSQIENLTSNYSVVSNDKILK